MNEQPHTTIVVVSPKSMVAALLLTFILGPLGLLYASIWGGIVLTLLAALVTFLTAGMAAPFFWIVSMIWAAIAVSNHNNRKIEESLRQR